MKTRRLGQGLSVSAVGLGCMGMSEFYGRYDDAQSLATLACALDHGVTFLDTADVYGHGRNEELIGAFLKERRRDAVKLATKFGIVREDKGYARGINNDPDYARYACEQSLKRLGTDYIDLFYVHRIEQGRPIEEVMGALSRLVDEGKIRHIGLSEASEQTLRRAYAVHPVTALQTEYSLWSREPELGILKTCEELGIGFVAYSPLGRGFLTNKLDVSQLEDADFRKTNPRFVGDNLVLNARLVEAIADFSSQKGCSSAQLILAWLLAQEQWIVPIPGTRRKKYLLENAMSTDVELSKAEAQQLADLAPIGAAAGERYSQEGMKGVNV